MLRRKFRTGQDRLQDNVRKRNSYMMADLRIQTCPHRFKITMDDSDLWGGFNMIWGFFPERPHLSGRGPGQWLCGLRPSAMAFPLQLLPSAHKLLFMAGESLASIIGVIIIWDWSHYRRRGFSFFHRAACSCHVVLQLWSARLQHCHIDCT